MNRSQLHHICHCPFQKAHDARNYFFLQELSTPLFRVFFSISLFAIGLYPLQPVNAEDASVQTLDPIIVTGSAHPARLHESTQSVTILEKTQYSSLHSNRISNILQQVPGVYIDEMGGRGGISSLYLRGADPNFTLIMLDGIPLNDSTNQRGGSVDLSTIPFDQIERIEVVRGPLSAFYGSEAMAGAINLITTSDSHTPHIRLLGEGGRFNHLKGVVQAGGMLGPVSTNLSYTHAQNGEQVEKDKFSQDSVGWNFSMDTHPYWDLQLTGQYTDSTVRGFPEGSGGPRLALLQETEKRSTQEFLTGITAALASPSGWQHQLFLSVSRRSQDVSNPGVLFSPGQFVIPPTTFDTLYHRFQARLTESWTITPEWIVSLGGQVTHERGKRNGTQDLSTIGGSANQPLDFSLRRTLGGSFAEITSTWWPGLTVNSGLRLDLSQDFQPNISPRIGASYQLLPLLQIRGGYGKGFKLPSLASLGDPLIGNPALEPETSHGWDIGIHFHTPKQEFTASIEYFHNRFRKLIDLDPDQLNQGIFQLVNLDEATTKGLEFFLSLSPIPKVSFQGNLTYLTTRVTETGDPLRNRPKWRGGLGLDLHFSPTLEFKSQVTFVSSRLDFQIPTQTMRVGGYTKVDLALTYHPLPAWRGYVALENVTDASYEEFQGFPAPPLMFRLGIEYRS
ncbi:MAG: TonB-dependent receptor [Nitrospirales bacterium]